MGQALYRTYRSKKLSEVVGQEHITTALDHALSRGTISHAYLFTGPRGVGKTSVARILAHEINALPYSEDRPHLDIIEIDAASNRRIDEIRDLRDKVHIAPSSAKYKVYIIDEVHMLTKEAFNALLKTLEEPPAHVVFILATTEAHKLPETIVSRTQRYTFKPIELAKVVDHLKEIAKAEKIDISEEAVELVAAHGEGSFRDSISLLDQVRNTKGKVTLADVQASLGIAPAELLDSAIEALQKHDSVAVARTLATMHEQGYEAAQIAKQLGGMLRTAVLEGHNSLNHDLVMKLLTALVNVPASPEPRIALEIALLDAALAGGANAAPKVMPEEVQTRPTLEIKPKHETKKTAQPTTSSTSDEGQPLEQHPPDEETPADDSTLLSEESWQLILNALKQKHNTLYSIAKTAHVRFDPGVLTLELSFPFYQKRLNDAGNKQALLTVVQEVTGSSVRIACIVNKDKSAPAPQPPLPTADDEIVHQAAPQSQAAQTKTPATASTPAPQKSDSDNTPDDPESIKAISNIFGGAELLES
jgi:DNA polymerase-3 subunit gamma/tau